MVKCHISKVRGDMTIGAVLVNGTGRYVVREFTHTDYIVVARITVISDVKMTIGASAKGSRGMTKLAILVDVDIDDVDRHVLVERGGKRHAGRRTRPVSNMTGIAPSRQNSRVGVVDAKCRDKTFGVMATATITGSVLMNLSIRRCSGVNTSVSIVA